MNKSHSPHTPSHGKSTILVVTLDGPAGVGKSTLAQEVAKALSIGYLDTGEIGRAHV